MKKINLKETAKKIQKNYRSSIEKAFKDTLKQLDKYYSFRSNKKARLDILPELEKCLLVSGKMPAVDTEDIFNLAAPLELDEYLENRVVRLTKTRVPTIDNIYKDLVILKKEFKDIGFKHNILFVRTDDIILEDVNFGPFNIHFDTSNEYFMYTEDGVHVEVEPLRPNFPSCDSSHPHPHVEDGAVCVGDGEEAVAASIRDIRILDYFSIVNAILNTYGSGPFEDISAWTNDRCNDCSARYYSDEMRYCENCGEIYCYDCISECITCGELFCAFCMEYSCNNCGDRVCNSCVHKCVVCSEVCCDSCSDSSCCGRACVDNCCENCSDCGDLVCNSCIITCSECGGTYCKSCVKECGKCSKLICENCTEACNECSSPYHDGCEYECCE